MKKLTSYLTQNPIIVLIMFLISLIGGIIGIALGWNQFYSDYLSYKIEIPIWLMLILIIIFLLFFLFHSRKPTKTTKELETIEGQRFGVQQINLDGKRFVNCSFDGSELIFKGENGFALEGNSFNSPPRFRFESYAGTTMAILQALRSDDAFKKSIEALFSD